MRHYAIGLDIGITSVGWATVALDADENPCGIIGLGSRIFDAAEQPKTGESLAAPRREARSARRRLRRHRHRNERIRSLMIEEQLISQDELAALFDGRLEDIYALRVKALMRSSAEPILQEYCCTYHKGADLSPTARTLRQKRTAFCWRLSMRTSSA